MNKTKFLIKNNAALSYGLAVLIPCTGVALQYALFATFFAGRTNIFFILLYPAVYLVSWLGGFMPGTLATLISVVGADYVFFEPHFQLGPRDKLQLIRMGIFIVMGTIISYLNGRLLNVSEEAWRGRQKVETLLSQIRDSEEQLSLALEGSQLGIWNWDVPSNKLTWSEQLCRLYGVDPATFDVTYKNYFKLVHPDDRAMMEKIVSEAVASRKAYTVDHRCVWPDGSVHWLQGKGRAFFDENGNLVKISGTSANIDEQKLAQSRAAILQRVTTFLASAATPKDVADVITTHAVPALGVAKCNFTVMSVKDPDKADMLAVFGAQGPLVNRFENPKVTDPIPTMQAIRAKKKIIYANTAELKAAIDPELYSLMLSFGIQSVISIPLITHGRTIGAFSLCYDRAHVFTDIEFGFLETLAGICAQTLERARLFSAAQEAIRARDEFLSMASHELRTPLTSLKLQSQMRKRALQKGDMSPFAPDRVTKTAESEVRQIERLSALIDDMLDVARINEGRLSIVPEEVNLKALVTDLAERYGPQIAGAGCSLKVEVPENVTGFWDRHRIEQVLTNMLTNALKYGSQNPITVCAAQMDSTAEITVTDRGRGIAKEDQARIFDRFERATSNKEISGLGLGLYIVRKIVEAHDGKVSVQSEPGQGSTFKVELPLRPIFKNLAT